ncbi:MAG: AGE family epimerase/isomerase [Chitinophagaceae bacterium]
MQKELADYKHQLEKELQNILSWWMNNTIDHLNGGFYGKVDHHNKADAGAPKGSVLNARILWTFSAAYRLTGYKEYQAVAQRAFQYFLDHFIDRQYGGVFWTVDYKGNPLDTKKQFYALAFAVYALSEYYLCSQDQLAKEQAIELYKIIVQHSYDKQYGGYIEALSSDWSEMGDIRLSAKDANEKKSMNTHLHVLEAFTNLYRIWPDEILETEIKELIGLFHQHIINAETGHLQLFFDMNWQVRSGIISYGHDIEAAWLVPEAAVVIGNTALIKDAEHRSVAVAKAAAGGLDSDGGLWYEYETEEQKLIRQKHWWPQAEAMVGFFHAWQATGDESFLQRSLQTWQFVQQHILDKANGEWVWGVYDDYSVMNNEDKGGLWKCPYHNSRACIELINRITGS